MSVRPQHALLLAAATLFAVAGCKQTPAPAESVPQSQPAAASAPTQIGGQDIVKLERKPTANGQKPEFLTATVLPGRGMNLFHAAIAIEFGADALLTFDQEQQDLAKAAAVRILGHGVGSRRSTGK